MKMFVVSKKLLSTAFGVAALAVASLTPAFAQSRSQYGSPLPRYYVAEGARVWGSWAPPDHGSADSATAAPSLYVRQTARVSRPSPLRTRTASYVRSEW